MTNLSMKEKLLSSLALSGLAVLNTFGHIFDEWAARLSVLLGIISALIIMRYYWFKGNAAKKELDIDD